MTDSRRHDLWLEQKSQNKIFSIEETQSIEVSKDQIMRTFVRRFLIAGHDGEWDISEDIGLRVRMWIEQMN